MKTNFDDAYTTILKHEGGWSDHANDKGGATKYGISLRFLKLAECDVDGDGHVTKEDIRALTPADARNLYKTYFWDHYGLGEIKDLWCATKAFDLFVNMRGSVATRILQRACVAMGKHIAVDGIIGPMTRATLNTCAEISLTRLAYQIRCEQMTVYNKIVEADPSQKVFLKGWLNRARF